MKDVFYLFCLFGIFLSCKSAEFANTEKQQNKQERVIISTDIGGTDDDDFQSMIHYLMYSNEFQTEGLIASPFGGGRKEDILHIIDLYEKDYPKLKKHSQNFPTAEYLRSVTVQGGIERAPLKGWSQSNKGSDWIIKCAKKESSQPLWVLVWGGLEDVAQALHDAPEIADKLKVYWIGGPNKKWSANAYNYVANNFPDLFMIETNSTYRGLFVDDRTSKTTNIKNFYEAHIKNRGALGNDFIKYYEGIIKMGDTPSVAYLLNGDPEKPNEGSWGGKFVPLKHSSRRTFYQNTSLKDTVPVFSLMEWIFAAPAQEKNGVEPQFTMEINNQEFEGYYKGNGEYKIRFVTKSTGNWKYKISSEIEELDGLKGEFVSVNPWPGKFRPGDITLINWWSDDPVLGNFEEQHQGAKTIFKYQEAFLLDWVKRWDWLQE